MTSNSWSIFACMRWVSLRKRRSLPNPCIHAGSADGALAGLDGELVLDRFGEELLQRLPTFGGFGFNSAEQRLWNFDGRFHRPILPYLRDPSKERSFSPCAIWSFFGY